MRKMLCLLEQQRIHRVYSVTCRPTKRIVEYENGDQSVCTIANGSSGLSSAGFLLKITYNGIQITREIGNKGMQASYYVERKQYDVQDEALTERIQRAFVRHRNFMADNRKLPYFLRPVCDFFDGKREK